MKKEILKELNILYAEDEDDVRVFTTKTLETLVANITPVENGKIGLETFQDSPQEYNLIITDINMPKLNGLEMCEEIRKINPNIPIVITSAHSDENFLKRSIEVGVSSYTMKPIDLYQLIESIIKAAEPQYLRNELEKSKNSNNQNSDEALDSNMQSLKQVLDSQENIIFVSDGYKLDIVNKKFIDFFKVQSKEDFLVKHQNVHSLFFKEAGLFNFDEEENTNWIEQIINLSEINRIIKLSDANNHLRTFVVNADKYEQDENKYVVSFTDITEIRKKSALLEYQANHDPLTGLLNRTAFNKIFDLELKRDIRYNHSVSLILYDIDDFKKVNDTYGHNIGDEVLKNIAKISTENVREHDSITRWGGEEFIVLLPETDIDGATQVAQKIRESIEEYEDSETPQITSSFGVVQLEYEDTKESFIKRADDALYEAKKTGKNKVVTK
jgi:two-component system cell cycle response regulator